MRNSIRHTIESALAATALAVLASSAHAQTNSLFGNSGAVSQSGGSFNQLGSTSSSSRSTSSATQGRQANGLTAGTQQGGLQAGGPALAETGSLASQVGQSGFVGGRGNSESFIGGNQQTGGNRHRHRGKGQEDGYAGRQEQGTAVAQPIRFN